MKTVTSIRFSDLLPLALQSLKHNRLRSGLTMGAIGVGIAVMVYLVSMGFGMEKMTLGEVAKSNALLSITVRSPSEKLPLGETSVEKIKKVSGVKEVLPMINARGQLSLGSQLASTTIVGADSGYLELANNTKIMVGNYYRDQDEGVMVVTTGLLKLFGMDQNKVPLVPFSLQLDPEDFPYVPEYTDVSVRGVVDAEAAVAYFPRALIEKLIMVGVKNTPETVAKTVSEVKSASESTTTESITYQEIKVKADSLDNIESVQKDLIGLGFKVETVAETMTEIKNVFFWIRLVLGSLGFVAIIVASIGMFNTLTISLLERTKEIGIMKSLGAKKSDITRLFMTEAISMGVIGGSIGLLLAFVLQELTIFILSLLASISTNGNVPAIFLNKWYILVGAMLFSVLVSILTGYFPARRATRLNPIEAIKYE